MAIGQIPGVGVEDSHPRLPRVAAAAPSTMSHVTWAAWLPAPATSPGAPTASRTSLPTTPGWPASHFPPSSAGALNTPYPPPVEEPRLVAEIEPGAQIGGYVIERLIGRGGMGMVFKGYHHRLQRVAAVKVLAKHSGHPDAIKRFEREAQMVARLRHPNIMSVFDFGEFNGQPYMVAEYMPNGSMHSRMPAGPATPAQAIAVLRPLASALDYAHLQGVVHRDVKPANVFLDAEFKPVLADFGLAKLHNDVEMSASGTISGTPSYIAPEQATGANVTGATDRYSLAVMAYRLFSGQLPFKGSKVMDILYAQVHNPPPLASTHNPSLPAAVDAVLNKGLAKDPVQRWATCTEMVDALEAAMRGTLDATIIMAPQAIEAATAPPPRGGRRRLVGVMALTLALSLLAAGAALAFAAARQSSHPQGAAPAAAVKAPASRHVELDRPGPIQVGDTVTLTGSGFDPRSLANVGIPADKTHIEELSSPVEVAADGTFTINFTVPTYLKAGPTTLRTCNVEGRDKATNCIDLPVRLSK